MMKAASNPSSEPGPDRLARRGGAGRAARTLPADVDGDDRGTDVDRRPGLVQQLGDRAGVRAGQLDGGLGRLHLAQRLVDRDRVAGGDQPLEDLALGQALPDVGQLELAQLRHGQNPSDRSTASSTRSRSGRYSSSSFDGGYGVS